LRNKCPVILLLGFKIKSSSNSHVRTRFLFIKRLILSILTFVLLHLYVITPSICRAVISLSVSPYLLEFEVPAGGVKTFTLTLYNEGDEKAEIRAYLRSLHLSLTGEPQPGESEEGDFSCASWISLSPSGFTVEPEGKKKITGILKVPRGERGGRYACILFETDSGRTKESVRISTRLGVVVMMSIPRTGRREGKIVNFSAAPTEKGVSFKVIFINTGNIHLKTTSSLVRMDEEERIVDRINLSGGTGTVLPSEAREFSGIWTRKTKMVPGKKYIAEVRVIFPGGRWVREKFEFSLPPKG